MFSFTVDLTRAEGGQRKGLMWPVGCRVTTVVPPGDSLTNSRSLFWDLFGGTSLQVADSWEISCSVMRKMPIGGQLLLLY